MDREEASRIERHYDILLEEYYNSLWSELSKKYIAKRQEILFMKLQELAELELKGNG